MSFTYVELTPAQAQPLLSHIKGPVLTGIAYAAQDAEAGALLLDLGGRPDVPPERGEPPGHYNLIWNGQVYQAAGHIRIEEEEGSFIHEVTLDLIAPPGSEAKIDALRTLFAQALAVLLTYGTRAPFKVRVLFSTIYYQ